MLAGVRLSGWPAVTTLVSLLFVSACDASPTAGAASTRSPLASPSALDPFPAPPDDPPSTSGLGTVPATAGEPVQCSELPVSGYYRTGYTTRSCWVVRENTL